MKCQYGNCLGEAKETWAMVHLCSFHFDKVYFEACSFYNKRILASERTHYLTIRELTPWREKKC